MRVINIGAHTVQKYHNPMCACIGYFGHALRSSGSSKGDSGTGRET